VLNNNARSANVEPVQERKKKTNLVEFPNKVFFYNQLSMSKYRKRPNCICIKKSLTFGPVLF
jgi:hypothetical protein